LINFKSFYIKTRKILLLLDISKNKDLIFRYIGDLTYLLEEIFLKLKEIKNYEDNEEKILKSSNEEKET
jgi:hypothetical protein